MSKTRKFIIYSYILIHFIAYIIVPVLNPLVVILPSFIHPVTWSQFLSEQTG